MSKNQESLVSGQTSSRLAEKMAPPMNVAALNHQLRIMFPIPHLVGVGAVEGVVEEAGEEAGPRVPSLHERLGQRELQPRRFHSQTSMRK
jgi:hypothetical protein